MRVGRGGRRVAAELGLESEPGTRKEESPTGGAHLSVAERRGRRYGLGEVGGPAVGGVWAGLGCGKEKWAGGGVWAAGEKGKRREGGGLGQKV